MTQKDSRGAVVESCIQIMRLVRSEVRALIRLGDDEERRIVAKSMNSRWREKLLVSYKVPVPQTDTGGRQENCKTNGRTIVKELCKMTP